MYADSATSAYFFAAVAHTGPLIPGPARHFPYLAVFTVGVDQAHWCTRRCHGRWRHRVWRVCSRQNTAEQG